MQQHVAFRLTALHDVEVGVFVVAAVHHNIFQFLQHVRHLLHGPLRTVRVQHTHAAAALQLEEVAERDIRAQLGKQQRTSRRTRQSELCTSPTWRQSRHSSGCDVDVHPCA